MAVGGRQTLRDIFDESPTPHIAHPPTTHQRDYYVATDGSFSADGSGLGVIIEGHTGDRVTRISIADDAPDNNVAEYRALHLGLDVLADRAPPNANVGVIIDHNDLAANVNTFVINNRRSDYTDQHDISIPSQGEYHWRGIRARVAAFGELRAACVNSRHNPAHPLANTPYEYRHVNNGTPKCLLPDVDSQSTDIPPPSRTNKHAGD
ncbi:MAG: ribonuclease H [Halobacteriaceae archaeon]